MLAAEEAPVSEELLEAVRRLGQAGILERVGMPDLSDGLAHFSEVVELVRGRESLLMQGIMDDFTNTDLYQKNDASPRTLVRGLMALVFRMSEGASSPT
ncbi:hypothetical protein CMI48_02515 [Candidatus Pacearchaeota archaeon]|nr:hypothetical protein [Candidatus Pacearchaeota archaeon]